MSTEQTPTTADPPPARWLTSREAQEHFHIAERTVRLWLESGKLKGHQVQQKGRVEWRIWSVQGEEPPPAEGATEAAIVPAPDLPPAVEVLSIVREQFAALRADNETLRRENQAACHRIGALEQALRDRLPVLEEGTCGLRAEVKGLAAAGEERSRQIRCRLARVTVALAVLAVLLAAVGGMVLTPRGEPIPRSIRLVPRSTAAPEGNRGGAASPKASGTGRLERRSSGPAASHPGTR